MDKIKMIDETICSVEDIKLLAGERAFTATKMMPKKIDELHSIVLCFHGMSSSKKEWAEINGYTKGGNLVDELVKLGYGFITFDSEWHGEHFDDSIDLNSDLDDDDKFMHYANQTIEFSNSILDYIKENPNLSDKKLATASYSLGSVCSTLLMNKKANFDFALSMVPETFEGDDIEFAPYNNMDNLKDLDWLFILASKDEYVEYKSYQWFMDHIDIDKKKSVSFESGHALPVDYVGEVKSWLNKL